MDIKTFFESKLFIKILIAIGIIVVFLLVFKAGEFVGFSKAGFSYRFAENYHRNFGGPRIGPMGMMFGDLDGDGDFMNAHGISGVIIKIDPVAAGQETTLVIKGRNNKEQTIIVSNLAAIRSGLENLKPADLKVDQNIVIIGSPDDKGQIEAKFIRVFGR